MFHRNLMPYSKHQLSIVKVESWFGKDLIHLYQISLQEMSQAICSSVKAEAHIQDAVKISARLEEN